MKLQPETYREEIAYLASPTPDKQAAEKAASEYASDKLAALRPAETPCDVPQGTETFAVRMLVNATLAGGAKAFAELESAQRAQQALHAVDQSKMERVVAAMGYYTPSLLDPKVSRIAGAMPIALGRDEGVPASRRYASALTIQAAIDVSYAGNAGDNRLGKLLAARLTDSEAYTATLLERLMARDAFGQALMDQGLAAGVADAAVAIFERKKTAGLRDVSAIDGDRMKTVYVPDGHGSYYQVTPTPSIALYTEIPRRTRERAADDNTWIPRSRRTISAKPQNVGLQVNYQGGRLTRLHATYRPLNPRSHEQRLQALRHGAPFFQPVMLRDAGDDLKHYVDLCRRMLGSGGDAYVNTDIRQGRDRRAERLIGILVDEARTFREYCAEIDWIDDPSAFERTDYVPDVLVRSRRSPTADEVERIANDMAQTVLQAAQYIKPNPLATTEAMDDRVVGPLKEVAIDPIKQEFGS